MSPCETVHFPVKGISSDTPPVKLENYAVTTNGFLSDGRPLERLPHAYYAPWESSMDSLAEDIAAQTVRDKVNRLPVLSTDLLATELEWRRAFVVLGFLTHAYIWGGDTAAETLPPPITLPLLIVSSHLGMPPVATYACLNLWNFRTTTSPTAPFDPTNLDTLTALHTFTGTPDESWFYMVSVAMEAQGAHLVPHLLAALEALQIHSSQPQRQQEQHNLSLATRSLHEMTRCIGSLAQLIDRMHERCDPQVFYHRIRPFLAGSKNMAAAGLPRGVFYDEGSVENLGEKEEGEGKGKKASTRRKGQWRQLRGGSNGQSSLIQFMDIALGVEHKHIGATAQGGRQEEGKDGEGVMSFHEEVRGYMPGPHRRFLEVVAERYPGGMKKAVERMLVVGEGEDGGLSREQLEVQEAFQTATRALAEFRNRHLQMVTRYIIIPSRQANGSRQVNLATASSRLESSATAGAAALMGTGGTALLPFLKQSRDETLQAGQLHRR